MKFKFFIGIMLFCAPQAYCFQDLSGFQRHLDSAETNVNTNTSLSKIYLDSIGAPSEKNLKEHIAKYYYIMAQLAYEDNDRTASMQYFIKSFKYAEQYKEYTIAARAAGEVASRFYLLKKDSLATIYYNKAYSYYIKTNDEYGLLDLMQFPAYAKYVNSETQESIDLVLKDLDTYKNVAGDQMYYSFAIYLLTSNYLELDDIEKALEYNKIYKSLAGHEFIEPSYYLKYNNAINVNFAEYYHANKNLDSIKFYLDAIKIKRGSSDFNVQKDLYSNYAAYYKLTGETDKEKIYTDSLHWYNEKMIENTITASVEINDDLSKTTLELSEELASKRRNKTYTYILIVIVVVLGILLYIYFRKIKKKEFAYSDLKTEFSSVKSKQEKLAIKNIEFEEFLTMVRKEIKRIATIHSLPEQQSSIRKLYKEIHLNHSNFINSEDHHKLLSSVNESFFTEIEKKYPELDTLEVQICYYLFTGFKNKEIAIFTGRSVRAIEGKRYRIVKKLGVGSKKEGLKDFLERSFKKT